MLYQGQAELANQATNPKSIIMNIDIDDDVLRISIK